MSESSELSTSGGPNFGFDWCTDHVTDDALDGVDLSRWSVAYNGSEPIRAATLDRFARRFEPYGFRRSSFVPCFGLAEFTLFVSGGHLHDATMEHRIDPAELVEGRVRSATHQGRTLIASGPPAAGTEVRIVDGDGHRLGDERQGEILVGGSSRALGYWRNQAASAAAFGLGPGDPHPGFLRTGDLGYIRHGKLFVTGRRTELIVVRGRNLHPHDLEATARQVTPDGANLSCVAFAVDGELVMVCESARPVGDDVTALAGVARDVRLAVAGSCGVQPRAVALVPKRTVLKTSSGKLRRLEMAARFRAGELPLLHVDELDPADRTRTARPELDTAYRPPTDPVETRVAAIWEQVLAVDGIGADDAFLELGGDSLAAAHIATRVGAAFGLELELSDVFESHTVAELAAVVQRELGAAGAPSDDHVEIVI